jgi:hypothetical protein
MSITDAINTYCSQNKIEDWNAFTTAVTANVATGQTESDTDGMKFLWSKNEDITWTSYGWSFTDVSGKLVEESQTGVSVGLGGLNTGVAIADGGINIADRVFKISELKDEAITNHAKLTAVRKTALSLFA